jgi:hypothetical protein
MPDYYSEVVLSEEAEQEVYESIPSERKHEIVHDVSKPDALINDNNESGIIIEDANDVSKLRQLNNDFETKMKLQLLQRNQKDLKDLFDNSGNKNSVHENRLQRFTILETELRSLMNEIELDKDDIDKPLKEKVDALVGEIDSFKSKSKQNTYLKYWEEKLASLSPQVCISPTQNTSNTDISGAKTTFASSSNVTFVQMDDRISKLEKKLGYVDPESTESMKEIIDGLYTRTNLILDGGKAITEIESEIKQLIKNCELYTQNSKRIKDKFEIVPLTDKKLNILLAKIGKMSEYESTLEHIKTRLSSLNDILASSSHTIHFMSGLEEEFTTMETKLDEWERKLNAIDEKGLLEPPAQL